MRLFMVFALVFMASPSWAQDDLHAPWDIILEGYLVPGADGVNRFDYDGLRADSEAREQLGAYIRTLESTPVSTLEPDAQFAFWANLYNALTIRLIVDEAPERSIRQIRPHLFSIGPWGMEITTVEGRSMSLDDIEHGVMRPQFEAALVHYAVNCASIGCPNLMERAWRAETLEVDLETAARAYVNHPRGVTVTQRGLVVSRIYRWYREDFGASEDGMIAHLLDFAGPELAAQIRANPRIAGHEYDWSLNRP